MHYAYLYTWAERGIMDTKVLAYFLGVDEIVGIKSAATELGLPQLFLSRWLALLEREIGTPLLTRRR